MRTPASIAGHPIHPMLVTVPIGLWVFSFVCDLFYMFGSGASVWTTVAFYTMSGGIVGALLAAIPGLIDMLSLPPGPKKTAIVHMTINLTVVALFVVNVWLRTTSPDRLSMAVGLSAVSIAMLAVSGWLGGKLVYIDGVAVSAVDAPGRHRT